MESKSFNRNRPSKDGWFASFYFPCSSFQSDHQSVGVMSCSCPAIPFQSIKLTSLRLSHRLRALFFRLPLSSGQREIERKEDVAKTHKFYPNKKIGYRRIGRLSHQQTSIKKVNIFQRGCPLSLSEYITSVSQNKGRNCRKKELGRQIKSGTHTHTLLSKNALVAIEHCKKKKKKVRGEIKLKDAILFSPWKKIKIKEWEWYLCRWETKRVLFHQP